jgi:hypothetical protein
MTETIKRSEAGAAVQASLNYLADASETPVLYASVAGTEISHYTGNRVDHLVTIRDGRPMRDTFGLDDQGFMLISQATRVGDFFDAETVRSVYEPEVEHAIKTATGASHVVVFDHTLRADSEAVREQKVMRDPAKTVHNDYTDRSAPRRVRDLLPAAEAEARLKRRFAIVNMWRSIAGIVETAPIAVCDAQSVAPEDLVTSERRAKDRIGEVQQALFNPNHRWYYFPRMTRDEALLIKTYDSETDGRARFTIHTAFDDPNTPADASPRESIESRAFVFF